MKYFLHLDEDALESSTFGKFLSVSALSLPVLTYTNPNRIDRIIIIDVVESS